MMRWDWLHRDWLGHAMADLYWLFNEPPLPWPLSLYPPRQHKTLALTSHYSRPVIRAHLR